MFRIDPDPAGSRICRVFFFKLGCLAWRFMVNLLVLAASGALLLKNDILPNEVAETPLVSFVAIIFSPPRAGPDSRTGCT
jgi:hypothetical protein